ncbi:MAG: hypothetical protein M1839_001088 [Geoglossum umbratile]|nr:MAG: hypothetical protein M1839_001088 [Geoglossum umbratile]
MSPTEQVGKLSTLDKPHKSKAGSPRAKREMLAESWEDEVSAGEDTETETDPVSSVVKTDSFPNAPPPTPVSPTNSDPQREQWARPYFVEDLEGVRSLTISGKPRRSESRPEKTDAVARRMIAGALGVRAPKKTEEGREYEKAVRDRERKKRDQEREAQRREEEDMQRAKAAVWGD